MKGFSRRNIFYIKQWIQFYGGKGQLVQQPVALIAVFALTPYYSCLRRLSPQPMDRQRRLSI
jgi:hypothetical protein